jgi:hypothetical protein
LGQLAGDEGHGERSPRPILKDFTNESAVNHFPPIVSRVSFSVSEAMASAIDDIERSGILTGIPHPLKPTLKLAFEEAIYAVAEQVQQTGKVPRAFRFSLVLAEPRGDAAEQEMVSINEVLERARLSASDRGAV